MVPRRIIQGTTTVSAIGPVTIDGIKVLNTSDNGTQFVGIKVSTGAPVTITNSVFFSPVANGNDLDDRAILLDTTAHRARRHRRQPGYR